MEQRESKHSDANRPKLFLLQILIKCDGYREFNLTVNGSWIRQGNGTNATPINSPNCRVGGTIEVARSDISHSVEYLHGLATEDLQRLEQASKVDIITRNIHKIESRIQPQIWHFVRNRALSH